MPTLCQRCYPGCVAGLNNQTIRAASKQGERVELRDNDVKGLHVVVTVAGAATFYVRYRCPAGQRRYKLGRFGVITVDQARKLARAALAEVAGGADPAGQRAAGRVAPTLATVAARWMGEHATPYLKPRTVDGYRSLLDLHILPTLGRRKVASVTRADVERLHRSIGTGRKDAKARGGATGAANRTVALLSTIMNAAERFGVRPGHSNPCAGITRYREQPKERFLDAAERARLNVELARSEAASKGHPHYVAPGAVAAIRLLGWTGARLSEITGLTWSMVDLERACLRLPDSKTGAKVIELAPQAMDVLRGLHAARRPGVDLVVAGEQGGPLLNIQRAWRSIRDRAELAGVRIHDLRHSFASDALNAGVPIALVGAMLGHRNVQTTARYAHVADDARRRAVEAAGNAIEAAGIAGANVVLLPAATRAKAAAKPRSRKTKARN